MTLDQIDSFAPMLKTAQMVNLGGRTSVGEPLHSPHFKEIITKIRDINPNIVIDMSTNAYLLDEECADFLIANAPFSVTFSVHAATPESYVATMGTNEKKFHTVMKNIEYFCQAARGKQVRANINFGIGKLNYMDAVPMVKLAKRLGVNLITAYLYYKSPNRFMDDVSLYTNVPLANMTLQSVYDTAAKLGQAIDPPTPNFIKESAETIEPGEVTYKGGCHEPYTSFLMKSDPYREEKIGFCVCNRIMIGHADMNDMTPDDLYWAWHHPVVNSLRLPNPHNIPPICKFCKDPNSGALRSLNHEEYKLRRDQAVRETLAPFQTEELKTSPSGAIKLLAENIFSIDANLDEDKELIQITNRNVNKSEVV